MTPSAAQQEVGAGAQVLAQLSTGSRGFGLQRAVAHTGVPEACTEAQRQCQQGLWEILPEQAEQIVVIGAQQEGHVAVLA
uniref:Uncharacterized protein n=1 Tax=Tanacetum cinerariifolium TaxID=118510 RepID=A0A699U3T3_TANCI|nr:hypothetical protein [Tanacetum cinerariifolium]